MSNAVFGRRLVKEAPDEEKPDVVATPGNAPEANTRQRRGLLWVIGSFAICPCHLPLTLALLSTVLGGTALGVVLRENIVLAGLIIAVVWLFGTWRGLRLLRQRSACPMPGARRGGSRVVGAVLGLPRR